MTQMTMVLYIRFTQIFIIARQVKDYTFFGFQRYLIFTIFYWESLKVLNKSFSKHWVLSVSFMRHKVKVTAEQLWEFKITCRISLIWLHLLHKAGCDLVLKLLFCKEIFLHCYDSNIQCLQSHLDVRIVQKVEYFMEKIILKTLSSYSFGNDSWQIFAHLFPESYTMILSACEN